MVASSAASMLAVLRVREKKRLPFESTPVSACYVLEGKGKHRYIGRLGGGHIRSLGSRRELVVGLDYQLDACDEGWVKQLS